METRTPRWPCRRDWCLDEYESTWEVRSRKDFPCGRLAWHDITRFDISWRDMYPSCDQTTTAKPPGRHLDGDTLTAGSHPILSSEPDRPKKCGLCGAQMRQSSPQLQERQKMVGHSDGSSRVEGNGAFRFPCIRSLVASEAAGSRQQVAGNRWQTADSKQQTADRRPQTADRRRDRDPPGPHTCQSPDTIPVHAEDGQSQSDETPGSDSASSSFIVCRTDMQNTLSTPRC